MSSNKSFKSIGIARETESPENPGALEKRVAVIPDDAAKLIQSGCDVFVEHGAGEGVGYSDAAYENAGAVMQQHDEIYQDKDLMIKFKGPAMEDIPLMRSGSTLFCMAHFHSFPERAKLLEKQRINVIAMEHIMEVPARRDEDLIVGQMAADAVLERYINFNMHRSMDIRVIGFNRKIMGMLRRFANHNPASLGLINPEVNFNHLNKFGDNAVYVHDSDGAEGMKTLKKYLDLRETAVIDISDFFLTKAEYALDYYNRIHPPAKTGMRRIQCLHETGRAGARYGLKLLKEKSPLGFDPLRTEVCVLGYGNVGMGAIHECYESGVENVHILGKEHTVKPDIEKWLSRSHLIINGAEQPVELRGKNFLISNQHMKKVIPKGGVVIDLIGGSATNRSPVEPVVECTYLTNPYFIHKDIFVSALWGWPMMGMMKETAEKYSGQIVDVLLGDEELIDGLENLHPGVEPAWVCRPE